MDNSFSVVIICLLTLMAMGISAILAAADEAIERLTRARAQEAQQEGKKYAGRLVWLAEHWHAVIGGVRTMAVISHMIAAVCVTLVVSEYFSQWWLIVLITLGITFALTTALVRTSPRRWGRNHPLRVASIFSKLLMGIGKLNIFLGRMTRSGVTTSVPVLNVDDEEEFEDLMERASESGQIEEDERELLESVFEMGRTLVREVMVPRLDMVVIDADQSPSQAISLFTRSGFSRVPVVESGSEEPLGILYLKDVLRRTHKRRDTEQITVREIMREPVFVPETRLVDDLLDDMQRQRVHIAMVVDEWGGIAGLVTIEDLLEELVGEMEDEHDKVELEPEEIEPGLWRVPAKIAVDELGDLLGLEVDDDDVDTAAGILSKALGKVPIAGSGAVVQGLYLQAERIEGRRKRLSTVLVRKANATDMEKITIEENEEDGE